MDNTKLAQEKLAHELPVIMKTAAQHMTKLSEQNVELMKRAEDAEHELSIYKIARRMEIRGLHPNLSFEEKVAQLMEVPEEKLASMEQAVEIAAGGVKLPSLGRPEGSKTAGDLYGDEIPSSTGSGTDELDQYIESQQALSH